MTAPPRTEVRHGPVFWAGVVVGWAVIGFGVWGTFDESNLTHPTSFGRWFFGGLFTHDLLLAPVVLVAGLAVARWVPARIRPVVSVALFVAGAVALYSAPVVLGYGERPANPSVLPRDYAEGLALVLGAIALAAVLLIAIRTGRSWPARRRGRTRAGGSAR